VALTQVTDAVERLEKTYEGYNGVSLTNFALTTEPEIANGSVVEIGGAIWEASGGNESITGWAGIGNGNDVYIYVDAAGAATFSTTAPTWDTAKQGWYNGTDRAVAGLYKVDAATYADKYMIFMSPQQKLLDRFGEEVVAMKMETMTIADVIAADTVADDAVTGFSFTPTAVLNAMIAAWPTAGNEEDAVISSLYGGSPAATSVDIIQVVSFAAGQVTVRIANTAGAQQSYKITMTAARTEN
jgi:hypothetical protein